ncbi:MAG: hypothetical protein ACPG19_05025 [Saprospiraceae bacterium]
MKTTVTEIQSTLHNLLKQHEPTLQVRVHSEKTFEVAGTIPAMQGKKKVDGHYFATVMPKPKDARLYYFPIYTHVDEFSLSPELKKQLKGKSCFHIKKMSPELEEEIAAMIQKGVELYQRDGLI